MNRNEMRECLTEDRKRILGNTKSYHIFFIVMTQHAAWLRWKYVKYMRMAAFYQERLQGGSKIAGVPMMWYLFRKNLIGNKLGFEMGGYCDHRKGALQSITTVLWSFMENQKSETTAHYMVTTASVIMV